MYCSIDAVNQEAVVESWSRTRAMSVQISTLTWPTTSGVNAATESWTGHAFHIDQLGPCVANEYLSISWDETTLFAQYASPTILHVLLRLHSRAKEIIVLLLNSNLGILSMPQHSSLCNNI